MKRLLYVAPGFGYTLHGQQAVAMGGGVSL